MVHKVFIPGVGRLVRKTGESLDYAREAALEAGYITDRAVEGQPSDSTINDLLEALGADGPVYSRNDAGEAETRRQERDAAAAADPARIEHDIDRAIEAIGTTRNDWTPEQLGEVTRLAAEGVPPIEALETIAQRVAEEPLSDETRTTLKSEDRSDIPFYGERADEVHQPAAQRQSAGGEARGDAGEGRATAAGAPEPQQGAPRAGPSGAEPGAGERSQLPTEVVDTDEGPAVQTFIPGTEKESTGRQNQRKADAPLRASAQQKFTGDEGTIFGGPAPDPDAQGDMLAPKPRGTLEARSRGPTAERASKAIARVLETRKSAVGAVRRPDLGPITIDYGVAGNAARNFKGGWGLAHIIAKRQAEGGDGEAFARNVVPRVLAEGRIARRYGPRGGQRTDLMRGDDQATLSLHRHGKRETWLLTAFKWGSGDRPGFVPESGLRTAPSRYSGDVGAEPDPHITVAELAGKATAEFEVSETGSPAIGPGERQSAESIQDTGGDQSPAPGDQAIAQSDRVSSGTPDKNIGRRKPPGKPLESRAPGLASKQDRAGVRLEWDGESKTWLIGAFRKDAPRRTEKSTGSLRDLWGDLAPSPRRGDENVTPRPPPGKPSLESRATEPASEPVFYSALLRAVEGMAQPKGPAAQWAAMIQKAPGVKREELEWTGVLDWLGDQQGQLIDVEHFRTSL